MHGICQNSEYSSVTQRSGYARICLDRVLNISRVLNMPGFWICKSYTGFLICHNTLNMAKFWTWLGSRYASVTQRSEYARICLDRALNISRVLNMPRFRLWQGSEYASVTQSSKYVTIWLNISKEDENMPEYIWIYNNRQCSEYVSYKTEREVTLQVNECLLRNGHIPNPVKDLRFGKNSF